MEETGMSEKTEFNYRFNASALRDLRATVNEKQNLSFEKTGEKNKNGKKVYSYPAWDKMCAIMDRLDDTVDYLNSMYLGRCRSNRAAFDFYEYLNCSHTVISCIKEISAIFSLSSYKQIENSQEVFGDVLKAGGTDGLFFEYARSLFSVHPVCTDRNKYPYLKKTGSMLHCCPFVMWTHKLPWITRDDNSDLVAAIYTSKSGKGQITLPLYIGQFYQYTQNWIDYIPEVIKAINDYNEQKYEEFREIEVLKANAFKSEQEYITYLRDEYTKRFGNGIEDIFDDYVLFFQNDLKNNRNQAILEKYRNAIRYSLSFLRNSLQNMSFDGFENNGISHPEDWIETTLFSELSECTVFSGPLQKYGYDLSKAYHLRPGMGYHYFDQMYARNLLLDIKEVLSRFVDINGDESNLELYILARLAEYQNALNEKCLLNKNIPNDEKYRIKVLTPEGLSAIFIEEKEEIAINVEELLKEVFEQNTNDNLDLLD